MGGTGLATPSKGEGIEREEAVFDEAKRDGIIEDALRGRAWFGPATSLRLHSDPIWKVWIDCELCGHV